MFFLLHDALVSILRMDADYPGSQAVTLPEVLLLIIYVLSHVGLIASLVYLVKHHLRRCLWFLAPVLVIMSVGVALLDSTSTSSSPLLGPMTEIPEIQPPLAHWSPILGNSFVRAFAQHELPAVFRGVINVTALKKWSPEYLQGYFSDHFAALQMNNVEQYESSYQRKSILELLQALQQEGHSNATSSVGTKAYLAEENTILRAAPGLFQQAMDILCQGLNSCEGSLAAAIIEPYLWVGPSGTRTGLHRDYDPFNVLYQLHGSKDVWLIHPHDTPYILAGSKFDGGGETAVVDPFHPDLYRFPRFSMVKALKVRLNPGDALFVPSSWWHYAEAVTSSISLSGREWSYAEAFDILPDVLSSILLRLGLSGHASTSHISDSVREVECIRGLHLYQFGEQFLHPSSCHG